MLVIGSIVWPWCPSGASSNIDQAGEVWLRKTAPVAESDNLVFFVWLLERPTNAQKQMPDQVGSMCSLEGAALEMAFIRSLKFNLSRGLR